MLRILPRPAVAAFLLLGVPFLARPADPPPGMNGFIFELTMKGKSWQTGVVLDPGVKPPIGKVNTQNVMDVLTGDLPDFAADFLDLDEGGKFYLYYDGKSQWRVATNPNSQDTTLLQGQVANDGTFWMAGNYDMFMAGASVFAKGKVKFNKGTFDPKKISGSFFLVSEDITTGLNLKFSTKGGPLVP